MKGGGSAVAVTPRRFKPSGENTKYGDQGDKERERDTMADTALSALNINAISGRPICKDRKPAKTNQANDKQIKQSQAQTPIRDPNGNPTVVWNNAIFQCEEERGVWGVRTCSTDYDSNSPSQSVAEVSSNGNGTKDRDKVELHSKILSKNLACSLSVPSSKCTSVIQNCSPDLESIASSGQAPIHKKQSTQPVMKVLFSGENADPNSSAGECEESKSHVEDNIEEIEKEILRLTGRLEELRIQQAAKQKDQEAQCASDPQKELSRPTKIVKGDEEPRGSKVEQQPKSLEKQRRGRVVPAKFLQWNTPSKAEKKPFEFSKKGRGGISPKIHRRAASLGPAEHLRFSQMLGKGKEVEHGMQKFNNGSARKWSRGAENTKSMDIKLRSLSLSPIPQRPIERKGSNLRTAGVGGSMSARKPATTPLQDSTRTTPWLHPKKLFPAPDLKHSFNTNTSIPSSKACSDQQPQKPSPSLKNARFVPSRYGQVFTPSKEKSTKTPQSNLSSLRNVNGKRFLREDEFGPVKGGMDNATAKRRSAMAGSPNGRNTPADRTAVTPTSKTPGKSGSRSETKKPGSVLSKDSKPTGTPVRHEPRGQLKASAIRTTFANESNLVQVKPFERDITYDKQESPADGAKKYVFSAGPKSPDTLEKNRMHLPRIRNMRLTEQSPRDSGCIKRAVDQVRKKSFFASDENITTNSIDMKMAGGTSLRKEISDDIKHAFSFEDDEAER